MQLPSTCHPKGLPPYAPQRRQNAEHVLQARYLTIDQDGNDCAILCVTKPLNIVSMRLSSALLCTFLHCAGLGHRKDFSNNDNRPFEVQWFICVPWNWTITNSTFCPHMYLYVLCESQNKQRLFPYTALTGWFFIIERKCVYCAVRTEHLTFSNSTFCPHAVFMCFVWISEQTAIISLYSINWLVCITETESVYCAVRTGCLG